MRSAVIKIAVAHVHDLTTKASFQKLRRHGGDFVRDYFEDHVDLVQIA